MSPTASHRRLGEPFSTGASWLTRALTVSFVLHLLAVGVGYKVMHASDVHTELVDIELAPPPPPVEALPAEVARAPESAPERAAEAARGSTDEPGESGYALDAGVDAPTDAAIDAPTDAAPVDARPTKHKRPDAAVEDMVASDDGGVDAAIDAGIDAATPTDAGVPGDDAEVKLVGTETSTGDAGLVASGSNADRGDAGLVASGSGAGTNDGTGTGSQGPGVAAATDQGSGSGVAGIDTQPAVDGAPTTAGTAANLLAYFPPGHVVTALVRFDRLRDTEWEEPAEKLFRPMPDYQALFGSRAAGVADKLEMLVISSPRPRDATATTLVVHSALTRAELRDFLANPATPIAWSAAKGGMLGKRSGTQFQGDNRVLLSPWKNWVVLAPPADLGGLTARTKGSLDSVEATGKVPAWLQSVRTIEAESGDDKRGPALVLTLAGPGERFEIPDIGVGVTALPSPQRISLAMELVKQGWLIRGNIVFAREADAKELEASLTTVQASLTGSKLLASMLRKQRLLNLVSNLSLSRTGARVSYSTSMSIADARALLAAAAVQLDAYFAGMSAGRGTP